jgi:hypothetical protein
VVEVRLANLEQEQCCLETLVILRQAAVAVATDLVNDLSPIIQVDLK